jgi:hypothetical protein
MLPLAGQVAVITLCVRVRARVWKCDRGCVKVKVVVRYFLMGSDVRTERQTGSSLAGQRGLAWAWLACLAEKRQAMRTVHWEAESEVALRQQQSVGQE